MEHELRPDKVRSFTLAPPSGEQQREFIKQAIQSRKFHEAAAACGEPFQVKQILQAYRAIESDVIRLEAQIQAQQARLQVLEGQRGTLLTLLQKSLAQQPKQEPEGGGGDEPQQQQEEDGDGAAMKDA